MDGSNASLEAVGLACDIAHENKGKVYVVHVIEVKRTLPLDARLEEEANQGEQILERAEDVGREHKMEVDGEILQARQAGHAIVDEAVERSVDLIVLGVQEERAAGEFELGEVVGYVLRTAPCEVWVCRHPAQRVE